MSTLLNIHNGTLSPVVILAFFEVGLSLSLLLLPLLPHGLSIKYMNKVGDMLTQSSILTVLMVNPEISKLWRGLKVLVIFVSSIIIIFYLITYGIDLVNTTTIPQPTVSTPTPSLVNDSKDFVMMSKHDYESLLTGRQMASDQFYFNLLNTTCTIVTTLLLVLKLFWG